MFERVIFLYSAIKAFSKDRPRASNYFDLNIVDALKRVPGVSTVTVLGERKYAMRLWVDPKRLAFNRLSVDDVSPQWKCRGRRRSSAAEIKIAVMATLKAPLPRQSRPCARRRAARSSSSPDGRTRCGSDRSP